MCTGLSVQGKVYGAECTGGGGQIVQDKVCETECMGQSMMYGAKCDDSQWRDRSSHVLT